jgi:hypothetical protein
LEPGCGRKFSSVENFYSTYNFLLETSAAAVVVVVVVVVVVRFNGTVLEEQCTCFCLSQL